MPIINIKHASPLTADQADELIASLTDVYASVTQAKPEAIHVLIERVSADRWGVNGRALVHKNA
ncbi:tautomerase family protein [Pseudonocardia kunmingensis]|uniref:4-oxalocrotonate tautomerase family enzyme n=1 Tax=Pseudonocardia kunmingensis TaxID=630975 RepID=A0A543DQC2_9PSEU|nr:tautomerase family protein [Pseudonocardia kunmingensis]TQM11542.1 4-oxalocrotonate tautomerase family enzyme [Pseudonocardia kunmingensis]